MSDNGLNNDSVKSYSNQDNGVSEKEQSNQWNGKESPEIDQCKCRQLIFDKGTRRNNGVKTAFPTEGARGTENPQAEKLKRKNLVLDLRLFTKFNSKWIVCINAKCKTVNAPRR